MRAVQIDAYGDANAIVVRKDVPKPSPGPAQVLVEVHAASLNPVDSAIRFGYMHKMAPLRFPATLGLDFAGIVVEAGKEVKGFKPGDRVYGVAGAHAGGSGALADYLCANTEAIAQMPAGLGFAEAASLPLAGISALQALQDTMKLAPKQRILIHGAAGGIGSLAVQIARQLGAQVVATARPEAADFVRRLGADEVIDSTKAASMPELKDFDAMFDTTPAGLYKETMGALRKGGILVSMSGQGDEQLGPRLGVTALGQYTQVNTERLGRLAALVSKGGVRAQVDRVFPLEEAKEAFQARESGRLRGKIVIKLR